jgi:hypothetical protein
VDTVRSRANCRDRRAAGEQGPFRRHRGDNGRLPSASSRQWRALPPVKHKTVHHIQTAGPPATGRFRRLDPAKLAATKAEFSKLEKDGIIRRSSSNRSAPLHMVMKPDGTWQPPVEPRHYAGLLPPAQHPGSLLQAAWLQHLQQAVSKEGLLLDTSPGGRHTQDGGDYLVWSVGVPQDAIWTAQHWPVFPALYGRGAVLAGLCLLLPG